MPSSDFFHYSILIVTLLSLVGIVYLVNMMMKVQNAVVKVSMAAGRAANAAMAASKRPSDITVLQERDPYWYL